MDRPKWFGYWLGSCSADFFFIVHRYKFVAFMVWLGRVYALYVGLNISSFLKNLDSSSLTKPFLQKCNAQHNSFITVVYVLTICIPFNYDSRHQNFQCLLCDNGGRVSWFIHYIKEVVFKRGWTTKIQKWNDFSISVQYNIWNISIFRTP